MAGFIQPLLAASDDGTGKLIGFVILAIFWGIGALASAMKKAKQPAKTNVPPPLPTAAPPPVPSQQQPQGLEWARMKIPNRAMSRPTAVAAKPPPPPAQRKGKRNKSAQQAAKRAAPPPPPSQPMFAAAPTAVPPITAGAIGGAERAAAAASVGIRDLRASMTPAAMRKQFIVSELLQPPVALRDRDH